MDEFIMDDIDEPVEDDPLWEDDRFSDIYQIPSSSEVETPYPGPISDGGIYFLDESNRDTFDAPNWDIYELG